MHHSEFWAKKHSSENEDGTLVEHIDSDVYTHGLYTGQIAEVFCAFFSKLLVSLSLPHFFSAFLSAAHDIGKISYDFQSKSKQWCQAHHLPYGMRKTEHGIFSAETLKRFFVQSCHTPDLVATLWSAISGSHHGRVYCPWRGSLPAVEKPVSYAKEPDWERERQGHLEAFRQVFPFQEIPNINYDSPSIWFLAGLISVSDWIASNTKLVPEQHPSLEMAEQAIKRLHLGPLQVKQELSFQEIFGFPKNELQTLVDTVVCSPGLYIIEAPMGMGKTEAALWAAYKLLASKQATGIYFALPSQMSSQRIWYRMQSFAECISTENVSPLLIHSYSWLSPKDREEVEEETWFASSKRALLAPLGIGTIDQALLAILRTKHFFVRRFGLAGKVIILDEIHSYDSYTGTIIKYFCRELLQLGASIIITSATLTERAKKALLFSDFPIQTSSSLSVTVDLKKQNPQVYTAPLPEDKEVQVSFITLEEGLQLAESFYGEGASVLWICDTVMSAQQVYLQLRDRKQISEEKLSLLHSQFIKRDRDRLEALCIERFGKNSEQREACLLVATQVVEQSLDIDADVIITELAPTDMLLQRMGRLQRHDRGPRKWSAQFFILEENIPDGCTTEKDLRCAFGSKAYVYSPDILARSYVLWHRLHTLSMPSMLSSLLEETYQGDFPFASIERERMKSRREEYAKQSMDIWSITSEDASARIYCKTQKLVLYQKLVGETLFLLDGSRVTLKKKLLFGDSKSNRAE